MRYVADRPATSTYPVTHRVQRTTSHRDLTDPYLAHRR